ncbi:MAG: putative rane protein involved in D-alanine export [Verrucomicrobiaceae bacterium]|nr:putative rane protein involved in D-alanine export [Verrucomicrobiaceae bacterium]
MLFTRLEFLWLFLATFALYYLPGLRRLQVGVLLAASLVFYGWHSPELLVLLALSIAINAITSFQASRTGSRTRLAWASAGVVANLLVLGFFKYGALLTQLAVKVMHLPQEGLVLTLMQLPLPIGISFYTFEGISLLVDVLKGRVRELDHRPGERGAFTRHLANTSLFIAFFPHLIAGPILKASHFYPQIGRKSFSAIRWDIVARSLVTGYFMKMVIADNLKDYTFWLTYPYCLSVGTLTGLALLFGYAMQIFADCAGYSLIAIGLAAILGYELPPNFNFPYIADSLSDFWRRWHISLSTWLRDYLYFPLGGNRNGALMTYFNLLLVMALGGLWHGAAWSYMVWGCYHGLGLALERLATQTLGARLPSTANWPRVARAFVKGLRIMGVFVFVSLGWLLFKLTDIRHVAEFLLMLTQKTSVHANIEQTSAVALYSLPVLFWHALHLPSVQRWKRDFHRSFPRVNDRSEDLFHGVMVAAIILNSGTSNAFIYFQF